MRYKYRIHVKTRKSPLGIAKVTHCRKLIFMLELSTKNISLCRNSMKRITISFITICAVKWNLYKYFRYKYRLYFSSQEKKITWCKLHITIWWKILYFKITVVSDCSIMSKLKRVYIAELCFINFRESKILSSYIVIWVKKTKT